MRTDVDIHDLPARLDEVLALASAGQEVVLMANGTARARLMPVSVGIGHGNNATPSTIVSGLQAEPRVLGLRPGAIILAPDFNDPLSDEFWLGEE